MTANGVSPCEGNKQGPVKAGVGGVEGAQE